MQSDPLFLAFELIILILSIVIHEVAHGYAANSLGDPTARLQGRLTLNPLKHVDPVGSVLIPVFLVLTGANILFGWAKPVPYNPHNLSNKRWGEAIVSGAGVFTNLLIAVVLGLIARFGFGTLPDPFVQIAAMAAFVNLFLGLFNLVPLPPLDGYTFLRGIMPYRVSEALYAFEMRIRELGAAGILLVLFIFYYFLSGPFALLVQYLFALLVG